MIFVRAFRMEWTKLRTVPSTGWSLVALVGFGTALGAFALWSIGSTCEPTCDNDIPRIGLAGVYLSQLAVVAVASLAMTAEYETMLVRTTLAACPRRLTVLAAKAAVVIAVVLPASALSVLGSLAASRGILAGTPYPQLSLADGPVLRAFGGTVLYLGLIALVGLGVGAMVRHTGGAISLVLGLLYVLPIVAQFVNPPWGARIQKYSPMTAGLAIQATKDVEHLPIAPWPGLGVLCAYAAVAVIGGAVLFRQRDA